jgi:uncharacterized protein (DUF362 family)
MKRRDFFRKGIGAGLAAGAAISIGSGSKLLAGGTSLDDYDLVAVKGGEPGTMFDQAIQSLGGIEKYVKKGQRVVVKPNLGWDATPERAANTNPELMARIVEHCFAAGARDVYVFDNTINEWTRCYEHSGIEKAVKDAGAKVLSGKSKGSYHQIDVERGRKLKNVLVHELILESDVFINVPVLKSHGGTVLSISMKNMMGVVWDRRWWHANDLHQCIADLTTVVKPDLNVVDAYRVLKRNGPRGVSPADVVTMKSLIMTEDIVAADAAAAKLFGKDPVQIGHIREADELGTGSMDLSRLNIKRIMI